MTPSAAAGRSLALLLLAVACRAASIPPADPFQTRSAVEGSQAEVASGSTPPAAHPMAAYLALRPSLPAKPTFLPPLVDPSVFVDRKAALLSQLFGVAVPDAPAAPASAPLIPPGFFAAKKTDFLNALFNAPTTSAPARRALAGAGVPPGAAFAPGAFAAKKAAFLQKLFETLNATAAPLPPWTALLDDAPTAAPADLAAPADPAAIAAKKAEFLNALLDSVAAPTPKPTIVPPGFWSPFGAPPSAAAAPALPSDFWTPPGSPGALYKAKVASFLSKLFEQINATATPASAPARRHVHDIDERSGDPEEDTTATRRGLVGPFGAPADGAAGSGKPFIGGPFGAANPFIGGPFGAGNPFIGAANPFIGGPFGAKPAASPVDPSFFMDKKTEFLNQLAASKSAGAADGAAASSPFGAFAPTPKPTIVPPGFWTPFPAGSGAPAPTAKPTIVPPGFWSPFPAGFGAPAPTAKPTIVPPNFWFPTAEGSTAAAAPLPATLYADKKAKFLSTLFSGLKAAPAAQPAPGAPAPGGPAPANDAELQSFLQALAEELTQPEGVYLSRRSLIPGATSSVAQMAALKDAMVATVQQILQTKAAAAAAPPAFPYAKGPYGAAKPFGGKGALGAASSPYGAASSPYGAASSPYGAAFGPYGAAMSPFGASKKGAAAGKKASLKASKSGAGFPFWGAPAPTPDPTEPLQQRLQALSQAFDALAAQDTQATAPPPQPQAAEAGGVDPAVLLQLLQAGGGGKAGGKWARSLQFAVRQGQLSLPAGAEELLTAGGGVSPDQHEGGGLRLQIKVPTA